MTPAEIRESAEPLDNDIEAAKSAIKRGQMADAQAHLAGKPSDQAENARKELRRLIDLRDGAHLLAKQTELDAIEAEINARQPALAKLAEKVRDLKAKFDAAARPVGRNEVTERARAAAYAPYEKANVEYLDASAELRGLEVRRDQLARELAQALGDE
ncbi:MAG TPA: hypothetical protein VGI19_04790 [Candidatus Cybelea sp.]|jgi:chromosome segregation ATPase